MIREEVSSGAASKSFTSWIVDAAATSALSIVSIDAIDTIVSHTPSVKP